MKCRLCGNDLGKGYYTQGNTNEFKFYGCDVCELINYDLSTGLDQEKYADTYPDPFDENIKMNKAQTQSYQFIRSHLNDKGRVLDIGCGNGKLLHLFKNEGWNVKGLEISPYLARSIKNTLDIDVEAANFLEYENINEEKFDLIVLRHVLEHLPIPILAMTKINSLLKMKCFAVLEFPNIQAADLKFKRLRQKLNISQKKYKPGYKPGHSNEYSKKSFNYLITKTGFESLVWETYSYKPVNNFIYNRIKIGNKARTIIRKVKDL